MTVATEFLLTFSALDSKQDDVEWLKDVKDTDETEVVEFGSAAKAVTTAELSEVTSFKVQGADTGHE